MLSSMGVNIVLTMTNRASYGLMAANSAMKAFSRTAATAADRVHQFNMAARASLVSASSWAVGIAGVGAMMIRAAKAAGAYQAELTKISFTVLGDEKAFKRIKESIDQVSASSEFSKTVLAKGARELSQAGLGITEITKSMPVLADLMTISGDSVEATSSLMIQFMKGFKISADDIGDTFNKLFVVARETPASFKFLTTNMRYVARVSTLMNADLTDTSIILGTLAPQLSKMGMSGRALSQFTERMYNIPKKAQKLMAQHGIKLDIDDGKGGIRKLTEMLPEISRKIAGIKDAKIRGQITTGLFGMQGGALAALEKLASVRGPNGEQISGLEEVTKRIQQLIAANTYTLHDAAVQRRKDYDLQVETLKKDWENLQISMGTTFIPIMQKLTKTFSALFQRIDNMNKATGGKFFENIGSLLEIIVKYGSLLVGWKLASAGISMASAGRAGISGNFAGTYLGTAIGGEGGTWDRFQQNRKARRNIARIDQNFWNMPGGGGEQFFSAPEQAKFVQRQAAAENKLLHIRSSMRQGMKEDVKLLKSVQSTHMLTPQLGHELIKEEAQIRERIQQRALIMQDVKKNLIELRGMGPISTSALPRLLGRDMEDLATRARLQEEIKGRGYDSPGLGGALSAAMTALQAMAITYTVSTMLVDTITTQQIVDRNSPTEFRKDVAAAISQVVNTGRPADALSSLTMKPTQQSFVAGVLQGADLLQSKLSVAGYAMGSKEYSEAYRSQVKNQALLTYLKAPAFYSAQKMGPQDIENYIASLENSDINNMGLIDPTARYTAPRVHGSLLPTSEAEDRAEDLTGQQLLEDMKSGKLNGWDRLEYFPEMLRFAIRDALGMANKIDLAPFVKAVSEVEHNIYIGEELVSTTRGRGPMESPNRGGY